MSLVTPGASRVVGAAAGRRVRISVQLANEPLIARICPHLLWDPRLRFLSRTWPLNRRDWNRAASSARPSSRSTATCVIVLCALAIPLAASAVPAHFIQALVSDVGKGGPNRPEFPVFGADGNLYLTSRSTDEVLRYNGTTGAFMNAFVPDSAGGLDSPRELVFGPDGHLYVASFDTDEVLPSASDGDRLDQVGAVNSQTTQRRLRQYMRRGGLLMMHAWAKHDAGYTIPVPGAPLRRPFGYASRSFGRGLLYVTEQAVEHPAAGPLTVRMDRLLARILKLNR